MKEANAIRRKLGKVKGETGLAEVIDDLLDLHVRLMDRVARLEVAQDKGPVSPKPAREGTPGMRREVNRDVAGRRTGEPKRTERPVGRDGRVETDMERGII